MNEFNFNSMREVTLFVELCLVVCNVKKLEVETFGSDIIRVTVCDPRVNTLNYLNFERASIITTGKLSRSYK